MWLYLFGSVCKEILAKFMVNFNFNVSNDNLYTYDIKIDFWLYFYKNIVRILFWLDIIGEFLLKIKLPIYCYKLYSDFRFFSLGDKIFINGV